MNAAHDRWISEVVNRNQQHLTIALAFAALALFAAPMIALGGDIRNKKQVLILTGADHPAHDWIANTKTLVSVLEKDGRLHIVVVEALDRVTEERLRSSAVLFLNYSNWDLPGPSPELQQSIVRFLDGGGGLVIMHGALGAFADRRPDHLGYWPEYSKSIAARTWDFAGGKSGHDALAPFEVKITNADHPITRELKSFRTTDELYFGLKGDLPIQVLAEARSTISGRDEPMAFVYQRGRARIFQLTLGHNVSAIFGCGSLIRRGTSWTAGLEPRF